MSYHTTYPVLRGAPAGTNAEAEEARTIREAMDRNFMVYNILSIDIGWMMAKEG